MTKNRIDQPIIRTAGEADLRAVQGLAERWARSGETLGFEPSEELFLRQVLGHCFFVAERGSRVVGFIWGNTNTKPRYRAVVPESQLYVELQELYVEPECRSAGIGRCLVDASIAWARRQGIRFIVGFTATKQLDRVLEFYRRCGLEPWSAQLFMDLNVAGETRPRGS